MIDYKIIDNALPQDYFDKLQSVLMGDSFPWFYASAVALKGQPDPHFYFTFFRPQVKPSALVRADEVPARSAVCSTDHINCHV